MANILHRLSNDAPPASVRELIATKEGIERWWTGRPVKGSDGSGGELRVYFGDRDQPAAVFEVLEQTADQIVWRCSEDRTNGSRRASASIPARRAAGGTTLIFTHEGWQQESEFMHGCSTNWAVYLMSLKAGAEGHQFGPYPAGEMSRWD